MTPLIHLLPNDVINQIAAGEVVERPSSVIKELIENSLDSGATQIEISLVSGGLDEIQVLDNGCGISPVDLPLAIQRHATSKLKLASDLESIRTFGFRGEALSSICSVARVTLISRTENNPMGYQLILNEGIVEGGLQMTAAPQGTQVTVASLFINTPARRKFLRSSHTELSHCQKLVKEIALGNPGVRFTLRNENRSLATYMASHRKDRFNECLKLPWHPIQIKESREEMTLEAYFSPPEHAAARSELYLFINSRPVRHRPFLSAIKTAFLEAWGPGKEPIGACYLDLRRDWVDVNVHPQKWEVRCLQQESIYSWLLSSLRKQIAVNHGAPLSESRSVVSNYSPPLQPFSPHPKPERPFLFLFKTERFLICEDSKGLIISQLDELTFQAQVNQWLQKRQKGQWPISSFDIPLICRLPEKLRRIADQYQTLLTEWGFRAESFGDGDYAISSHPSVLSESIVEKVFVDFVTCLSDAAFVMDLTSHPTQLIYRFLEAERSSHSFQEPLPFEELLDELAFQLKEPQNTATKTFYRVPYQSPYFQRNSYDPK